MKPALTAACAVVCLGALVACDAAPDAPSVTPLSERATPSLHAREPGQDAVLCDLEGFSPIAEDVHAGADGVITYRAIRGDGHAFDVLSIALVRGPDASPSPGAFALGADYDDCTECVVLRTGCDTDGVCARAFLADRGRLIVEAVERGGIFRGHLEGVALREVELDGETLGTRRVDGGEAWCLGHHAFETRDVGPVGASAYPMCLAEGTGTMLGDNAADIALPNCHGDIVRVHDGCGASVAVALVATTGWCAACADQIAAFARPGVERYVVFGEDASGDAPTQASCYAYAAAHDLDPAAVLIDHAETPVVIPLVAPAGYGFETHAFATLWTRLTPYLSATDGGAVHALPWSAVLRGDNRAYLWTSPVGPGDLQGLMGELASTH